MAEGLNRAALIGNLGADPELRQTSKGTAVLNMRLATTERVKKGDDWEDHTEWHNVVVWGKRAEGLARILEKGNRVYVEGPLRTSSYEDKDGNKRYKTEINADNVVLAGGRGSDRDSQRNARDDRRRDDGRNSRRDDRRDGRRGSMNDPDDGDGDDPFRGYR